jgi:hypothetical protein
MLWSVRNSIGAVRLPVDAWAAAANALLGDTPSVPSAHLSATCEEDEVALDGSQFAGRSLDVLIFAADAVSAATTVERLVMRALFEVVGDREVGWTAYDREAVPAQV